MKLSKEVIQKIKHLKITTAKLLQSNHLGQYTSAKKGFGLEFDQIREYQLGDDIRFIDWNGSAKTQKLLVKQYIQEQDRSVMVLLDHSASTSFGSNGNQKYQMMAEIAAVFTLSAQHLNNSIGLLLFNDDITKILAPSKGVHHSNRILEEIFSQKPSGKTSINRALQKLLAVQKQKSIIILISDFISDDYHKLLKIVAHKHHVIMIKCTDPREVEIKNCGYLSLKDPETGELINLNTNNNLIEKHYNQYHQFSDVYKKNMIDYLNLETGHPFIEKIISFLNKKWSLYE